MGKLLQKLVHGIVPSWLSKIKSSTDTSSKKLLPFIRGSSNRYSAFSVTCDDDMAGLVGCTNGEDERPHGTEGSLLSSPSKPEKKGSKKKVDKRKGKHHAHKHHHHDEDPHLALEDIWSDHDYEEQSTASSATSSFRIQVKPSMDKESQCHGAGSDLREKHHLHDAEAANSNQHRPQENGHVGSHYGTAICVHEKEYENLQHHERRNHNKTHHQHPLSHGGDLIASQKEPKCPEEERRQQIADCGENGGHKLHEAENGGHKLHEAENGFNKNTLEQEGFDNQELLGMKRKSRSLSEEELEEEEGDEGIAEEIENPRYWKRRKGEMRGGMRSIDLPHSICSMVGNGKAVVKHSQDPRQALWESMVEMIVGNGLWEWANLEFLFFCYLSLNEQHLHPIIQSSFLQVLKDLGRAPGTLFEICGNN